MTETLYRAQPSETNWAGERDFKYAAEVDILGWKFVRLTDGALMIETPRATLNQAGTSMLMLLREDLIAVLQALLDIETPPTPLTPEAEEAFDDIGRLA